MDVWVDCTRSFTFRLNRSISGTCSFLDAQFSYIPLSSILTCRGSNSLSACMHVILNLRYRYSLWTCLIPYSMFFICRFLILLTVENMLCWDIVFRKTMSFVCMRSQHRVNFFYLSSMSLCTLGTITGSICWILWWAVLPGKYWKTGTIDVLRNPDIFSKKWEVLRYFIINCMQDSLYWLEGGVI